MSYFLIFSAWRLSISDVKRVRKYDTPFCHLHPSLPGVVLVCHGSFLLIFIASPQVIAALKGPEIPVKVPVATVPLNSLRRWRDHLKGAWLHQIELFLAVI